MPYIEVKLAKQASRKQERILTEKLGEAITSVPGKTAAGLMEEDLKIPKENVYTTFQYCDDFGVQGKFL